MQTQLKPNTVETKLLLYLSLTIHGWITPRNHELFNFHLEKLSSHSSYYERICSIGYNSHLNGSLHLLEGIKAEAFNKCLNLSDKWDKCIHDLFLLFTALILSEGILSPVPAESRASCLVLQDLKEALRSSGEPIHCQKQLGTYLTKVTERHRKWQQRRFWRGGREGSKSYLFFPLHRSL